jgi:hypothetical protein
MEGDLSEKGKSMAGDSKILVGFHRKAWPKQNLIRDGWLHVRQSVYRLKVFPISYSHFLSSTLLLGLMCSLRQYDRTTFTEKKLVSNMRHLCKTA